MPVYQKLNELEQIISHLTVYDCTTVPAFFGVKWSSVSLKIKEARLPMIPCSIARVLRKYAETQPPDKIQDILGLLRLKRVASHPRTWYVIELQGRTSEKTIAEEQKALPERFLTILRHHKNEDTRLELKSLLLGDLMYLSIQFVSETEDGSILYICTPPGESVALFTSILDSPLLEACIKGLGFKNYSISQLHGKNIHSLLQIANPAWAINTKYLAPLPEYKPTFTILSNGIDYTYSTYDKLYVEKLIGPNPPFLTEFNFKCTGKFFTNSKSHKPMKIPLKLPEKVFDKSLLNKSMNMSLFKSLLNKPMNVSFSLKSKNVAETLKSWVDKSALAPNSKFFQFYLMKKNNIQYYLEDSDSD